MAFEGTVTTESGQSDVFDRAYGFAVDRVVGGEVNQPSETVRISLRGPNGGSSCGIVQRLHRGSRYRVEAYQGELNGQKLLFANSCGGSVMLLAAPVAEDQPDRGRSLVVGSVLAAGAITAVILRRRSRR